MTLRRQYYANSLGQASNANQQGSMRGSAYGGTGGRGGGRATRPGRSNLGVAAFGVSGPTSPAERLERQPLL